MLYLKMDLTLQSCRLIITLRFQSLFALMPQKNKVAKIKLGTGIPVLMDVEEAQESYAKAVFHCRQTHL